MSLPCAQTAMALPLASMSTWGFEAIPSFASILATLLEFQAEPARKRLAQMSVPCTQTVMTFPRASPAIWGFVADASLLSITAAVPQVLSLVSKLHTYVARGFPATSLISEVRVAV